MADGSVKIEITADSSDAEKELKGVESGAEEAADGLEEMGDSAKKTSKETQDTKSKFQELTETISRQETELADLRSAYAQAIVNFGKSSTEANDLKAKMKELNGSLSDNKAKIAEAEGAAGKLSGALDETSGSFDAADVAAGNFVANGLSSLMGALSDALGSILELSDATREYREDMAKLDTAFTTQGHSTDTAKKAYEDFYALLGESDRSVEAVNHLAELTKSEEYVAKWSTIAAGVTAKFGDSLPIEGLTEAANETAKVGQVTGPLADALNWAGISEDEFNEKLAACNSEQKRAALITETLNSQYADAAAEYNELTAQTQEARRATSEMESAQAELGEAVEPVTTAITKLKAKALEAILPVVQTVSDGFQKLTQWFKENPTAATVLTAVIISLSVALGVLAAALAIGTLISTVTKAFKALNLTMLGNPIVLVVAAIAALVAAFVYLWNTSEDFRNFWIGLWENIKSIFSAVWDWLTEFFTVTIPQIFNDLVTSISEWFSKLWQSFLDFFTVKIPEFVRGVVDWFGQLPTKIAVFIGTIIGHILGFGKDIIEFATTKIPEFVNTVINFIKELPGKIWEWLNNSIQKVAEWGRQTVATGKEKASAFITGVIDFIKNLPGKVWEWLQNTIDKVVNFGSDLAKKGTEAAKGFFNNIVEGLIELPNKMLEIGSNIISGIWDGISAGWDWLVGKVSDLANSLVGAAQEALDSHSPSRKFAWLGKTAPQGLAVGWEDEMPATEKKVKGDVTAMVARVKAAVSAENVRMSQGVGTADNGFYDLARAVGTQTAGINSLAGEYRKGTANTRPIIITLNDRELGRAVVDVGNAENNRVGARLAY